MPQRSRYGAVDRLAPEAAGRCDRGGEIRKRSELMAEVRWSGNRLVPTGFLCCAEHIDPPQPQDRIFILTADPVPVSQPRPDIDAEVGSRTGYLTTEAGIPLLTETFLPLLA
jgi:hypothetical protein